MKTFRDRLTTGIASAAILANSFGVALPFVFAQKAAAVTTTEVVSPANMNGWEKYGSAPSQFVATSAPLGNGALELSADTAAEYSMHWNESSSPSMLANNLNVHYSTKRLTGPAHAAASYVVVVDPDGDSATSDGFYALYEPAYNDNGTENFDNWNTWAVTSASNFWYTAAYGPRPAGAVNYTPLTSVLATMPNATIIATVINFGSGNSGWKVLVDNIKTADDVIYDFEPVIVQPCTTTTTLHTTDMLDWDTSETRSTGNFELVADGLHIWTEGTTSTDKVAGYLPSDFALSNTGTPAIDYDVSSGFGIEPGLQLVTDFNNDGTADGILVGESVFYGSNWWASNSTAQFVKDAAPTVGGGGSAYNGSINQWLSAFPNARVKAIGYSLGSGVYGDGILKSITLGCVNYTFSLPVNAIPQATITTPAEASAVGTKANGDKLNVKGTFTDDEAVNYLQLELVKDGNLVTVYTMHYNNPGLNSDGTFSIDIPVSSSLTDGAYSLFYTPTDFEGGVGPRLERKFTIDNTAPNVPNNLRLQVRSTGNFVGNNGWTNRSDVTALWNSNNTEAVTYEYQYWNDVTASPYNSGNRWTNNVAGEQYPGTINQGEGKHYYCVVAIDAAGNRSACSAPFAFNYDGTNPVTDLEVSEVVNGVFTVSGDASDNINLNRVYVQLVSRVSGARCGGTTINLIPEGGSASWSRTYDIATLGCPEGNFAAHVTVVDMAGNTSSQGWTDNFLVEAPAATNNSTGVLGDSTDIPSTPDDVLALATGGQVLAASTNGLASTGSQINGILTLAAASILALALVVVRRKQEN